ncbi:hypothetical protein KGF54_004086 [Candida jiufengensis]|uniref:uncharacterized protein n=1 Tax=Candida jiufengensis TaxID=497108 RepID=UPI002225B59E|nr:uncharacterized protein KGF54_004086 [Candida jiufengensis]KAI5951012.1 hypothetical protein KGF54_004086 [Candida jiufengensis]
MTELIPDSISKNNPTISTPTSFINKPRPMSLYTTPPLDFSSIDNDEDEDEDYNYKEEFDISRKLHSIDDHKSFQFSFTPPSSINSTKDKIEEQSQTPNKNSKDNAASIFFTPEKSKNLNNNKSTKYLQPPQPLKNQSSSSPNSSKGLLSPSKFFKKFSLKLKNYSSSNVDRNVTTNSTTNSAKSSPKLKSKSNNSTPSVMRESKNEPKQKEQNKLEQPEIKSPSLFSTSRLSSPSLRYSKSFKRFSRYENSEKEEKAEKIDTADTEVKEKKLHKRRSLIIPRHIEQPQQQPQSPASKQEKLASPMRPQKPTLNLQHHTSESDILITKTNLLSSPRTPTNAGFSQISNSPKFPKSPKTPKSSRSEFYNASLQKEEICNTVISFSGYSIKENQNDDILVSSTTTNTNSPISMNYDTTLDSFDSYVPNQITRHKQLQPSPQETEEIQGKQEKEHKRLPSSTNQSRRNSYVPNTQDPILKIKIFLDHSNNTNQPLKIHQLDYISIKLRKDKLKNINELINVIIFKIMNKNKIINLNNIKLSIIFLNEDNQSDGNGKNLNPIILKNSVKNFKNSSNNEICFNNDELLLDYVQLKKKIYIRAQF